ncbi:MULTISPECIES: DUF4185 domain-containing protein [Streptomyces]|uniref:DUF4185 domain-containing protein n=1 Tax=Streptomyces TaxID=1883 RepID=UPI002249858C|nr:DUF4185 domain-containing protein [Streptomyces sp. JHD 1]MCX2970973.1 hypothetical protein [Streptomyces sp. JHD 1]
MDALRRRSATRTPLLLGGVVVLVCAVLLVLTVPGDDGPDAPPARAACEPLSVTGWRPAPELTAEFARYGDDNTRLDDWTGGDGSRSVPLPDGRTLWLSADTFLDRVHPEAAFGGPSRDPSPVWVRNAGLVMSPDGTLERTLLGPGPGALFPGLADPDGGEVWRWPVQGVVEPREPGAAERVVRVLLWQRGTGTGPWVFGVPRATEVATLRLPELTVESIRSIDVPPSADPAERVLYGTSAVRAGAWTYVFGADERTAHGRAARAHVARVPLGRLADRAAWRYWDGHAWQADPARAAPLPVGARPAHEPRRGASNTYTVARHGGTWLLLTTDAGGPDGRGLTTVTSYWACAPQGPWHGPSDVLEPPLPEGGEQAGAVAYNPQLHPALGPGREHGTEPAPGGGGLVLGYDVNVVGSTAAVQRDVELYRPRFVRLDLSAKGR